MFSPAVNVLDAISIDNQIIASLAQQLSGEKSFYQKHLRLILSCLFVTLLLSQKRQSPGQKMQNLQAMQGLCAVGILLPALATYFHGKSIPLARLALHAVILGGLSKVKLASDTAERVVITDYMYRLLTMQHMTSLVLAAAPFVACFLPKKKSHENACVFCGCSNMVKRQTLQPCNHYCCYVCSSASSYCGVCRSKITAFT